MKVQLLTIVFTFFINAVQCQSLVPYRVKNKWGFADREGKIVVEPQYDSVGYRDNYDRYLTTYLDGKVGFLLPDYKEDNTIFHFNKVPPQFDSIFYHHNIIETYKNGSLFFYKLQHDTLVPVRLSAKIRKQIKKSRGDLLRQKARQEAVEAESKYVLNADWYRRIPSNPFSLRWKFVDTAVLYTDFGPEFLPPQWQKIYSDYIPSPSAEIKKIDFHSCSFGIIRDSGKIGLLSAHYSYRDNQRPNYFSVIVPPVYDSLLYVQSDHKGACSFYLKKQDSIAVASSATIEVKPIAVSVDDLFYLDYYTYMLRKGKSMKLYVFNTAFKPELDKYEFDYIEPRIGYVVIHNDSVLQMYDGFIQLGKDFLPKEVSFEKVLEVPYGRFISLKEPTYIGPLLVQQKDGPILFYHVNNEPPHAWQLIYSADKLIKDYGDVYKIETNGQQGYIDGKGRMFFTD